MHYRVCFGIDEYKEYDKKVEYRLFVDKLTGFDYTTIKKETLDTITYEMNHFTTLRGGKFSYDVLEETNEACATLGLWIINWHKAGSVYVKLRAIEEDIAEKKAEADAEHQRKMD